MRSYFCVLLLNSCVHLKLRLCSLVAYVWFVCVCVCQRVEPQGGLAEPVAGLSEVLSAYNAQSLRLQLH